MLGVLIETLTKDQKSLCIQEALSKIEIPSVLFYSALEPLFKESLICMMQDVDAFDFEGILIAVDFPSLKKMSNCLLAKKRYFYIWDFDWAYENYRFEDLASMYLNKDIELIVRSQDHYDIVSKVWKTPLAVVKDFDVKGITELCSKS